MMYPPLRNRTQLQNQIVQARAASERAFELLATQSTGAQQYDESRPAASALTLPLILLLLRVIALLEDPATWRAPPSSPTAPCTASDSAAGTSWLLSPKRYRCGRR